MFLGSPAANANGNKNHFCFSAIIRFGVHCILKLNRQSLQQPSANLITSNK